MRLSRARWGIVGVSVVGVIVVGVWGIAVRPSGDTWTIVGTWVASVGTVAAVVVALLQSSQAREDATNDAIEANRLREDERRLADERLTRELEAARSAAREDRDAAQLRQAEQLLKSEELLARELEAQRVAQQVATLPPIWEVVSELVAGPYQDFRELRHMNFPAYDPNDLEDRQALADEAMAKMNPWVQGLVGLEVEFTTAFMTLGSGPVYNSVRSLYADTRELHDLSLALVRTVLLGNLDPDFTELDAKKSAILKQRKTMINLVRATFYDGGAVRPPDSQADAPS